MPHPVEILRKVFSLTPQMIERLNSSMKEEHVPKGTTIDGRKIIQENSYYISHGAARAYYIRDGKEHTMSFAFDDEYLMTRIVLNSKDIPLSIKFIEDSDIISIPVHLFRDELRQTAEANTVEALMFLSTTLLYYNNYLEERIYTLQCMNARERYTWAINRYPRLLECATITQVASFLGVTKETLYRIKSGKY